MTQINLVEVIEANEVKAQEWYANQNELPLEDVENYPFFATLQEAFDWVYLDENDSHQDTIDTVRMIANIDVSVVAETGVKTIHEYLALTWERLEQTPYGYLAKEI